jgi:hypothetical protein
MLCIFGERQRLAHTWLSARVVQPIKDTLDACALQSMLKLMTGIHFACVDALCPGTVRMRRTSSDI